MNYKFQQKSISGYFRKMCRGKSRLTKDSIPAKDSIPVLPITKSIFTQNQFRAPPCRISSSWFPDVVTMMVDY